jgi:class 3 adenylate cyclase/CHASE2 domain-containing sensor protein
VNVQTATVSILSREEAWLSSPWPLLRTIWGVAALWVVIFGTPFEPLEMAWLGQLLRWRSEGKMAPPVDSNIVHLDIVGSDLAKLPTLELEYQGAAEIIREAGEMGAKVIGFDLVFGRGNQSMAKPILEEIERAAKLNRAVVLAEALIPGVRNGSAERIRSFPFQERHQPAGLINVKPDPDGTFRRYTYAYPAAGAGLYEPSLVLACYLAWRDLNWTNDVHSPRPGILQWKELAEDFTSTTLRELKVEPGLMNFRSPWVSSPPPGFRHYTFSQLDELHERSRTSHSRPLENAILLVSEVAAGVGDVGITPLGANQPRVLLHSTALNDLIQRSWLRPSPRWADALALSLILPLGLFGRLSRRTIPLVILWIGGLALAALVSVILVFKAGWIASMPTTALIWTVAIFAELGRRQSYEFTQRLKLRATMSLYFSPHVMRHVLKNPGSMKPQEAELTVLLTDLRNSTAIAECLGASDMFRLLNQVFEAQTKAIMAEDGSMEHFLGDQFLSYWGAPDRQPDAADRAYRAALAVISGMESLRPGMHLRVKPLFGYGVALHSGVALLGNKGSAQRLDYGIVGDLINAAARVESLTKHYGVLLLITRETYSRLTNPPFARVVDRVIVLGKSIPLELLEVRHPFSRSNFEEIATRYNAAFEEYGRGAFAEAEKKFACLAAQENDRPSRLMAERCRELSRQPPKDWLGVYQLKTK